MHRSGIFGLLAGWNWAKLFEPEFVTEGKIQLKAKSPTNGLESAEKLLFTPPLRA
jgi:hypothetical protein